jgi:hypothetical protein
VEVLRVKLIADLEADFPDEICTVNSHGVLFNQADDGPDSFLNPVSLVRSLRDVIACHLLLRLLA